MTPAASSTTAEAAALEGCPQPPPWGGQHHQGTWAPSGTRRKGSSQGSTVWTQSRRARPRCHIHMPAVLRAHAGQPRSPAEPRRPESTLHTRAPKAGPGGGKISQVRSGCGTPGTPGEGDQGFSEPFPAHLHFLAQEAIKPGAPARDGTSRRRSGSETDCPRPAATASTALPSCSHRKSVLTAGDTVTPRGHVAKSEGMKGCHERGGSCAATSASAADPQDGPRPDGRQPRAPGLGTSRGPGVRATPSRGLEPPTWQPRPQDPGALSGKGPGPAREAGISPSAPSPLRPVRCVFHNQTTSKLPASFGKDFEGSGARGRESHPSRLARGKVPPGLGSLPGPTAAAPRRDLKPSIPGLFLQLTRRAGTGVLRAGGEGQDTGGPSSVRPSQEAMKAKPVPSGRRSTEGSKGI